ncbi:calcium-translocating P-type ATPase, PMCA-type [Clostridium sp. 2-1]|uniref:calcium-translocating P-type ATPase, PMCA-type n=1 Tax=Clostridium TaxID=1485 RepID=UPI000CDAC361|nr:MULTISPECIES: calcium-translocating P-type ATPase, PMCA-type [Clostridium]MBN7573597.1 calcium-translocating P-type ATPase, PMCA-type [Clostridium beijerinckii]MBN7581852.1 calcium-translocating P-type ATPase, PMCA-type [Clostridium beijerinckii]MBN7586581.1 calcium-translocating P-type ATPase, PMCA-type [Clostridium beijerinckii]MBO0522691.1 calcium-translocating P-type ATPase, PMCA-type [Clostridium beijerinckii]POO92489.1 calcium-translocating P-type ATPase, PMCA-type [Clostridium sp. 2-
MKYFNKDIESVLKELDVDLEIGLNDSSIRERTEKYGKNEFTHKKEGNIFEEIKNALLEPMMLILLIAALVSAIIGEYYDSVGIVCAVAIGITIGIITEGKSKKAAEALAKMTEDIVVKVLRNGKVTQVGKNDLVPGDIIYLETGDMIPADGRFIETIDLKVREDMLTGESEDVTKNAQAIVNMEEIQVKEKKEIQDPIPAKQINMGFGGTLIAYGRATMVVTSTGNNTEMGKIAQTLQRDEEETPLQRKLGDLGKTITKISSVIAGLLFIFMVTKMILSGNLNINTSGVISFLNSIDPVKTAFVVCIALIVAAVPEGLPTMINMTLAITMQKMAKINALVTKKEACETIGSVSVICSDKTGTLTENRMTVENLYLNGKFFDDKSDIDDYFVKNCLVNSTADISFEGDKLNYLGNSTECALLSYLEEYDYKQERKESEVIHQIPFNSENKFMATVMKIKGMNVVLVKGAPEILLSNATSEVINNKFIDLTKERKNEIIKEIQKLQAKSMRILGFGFRIIEDVEAEAAITSEISILKPKLLDGNNGLIFSGFVAIRDPLREDVAKAIETAKKAGIETKMLTGDNINTAIAIGNELGMLKGGKKAVEATYIDTLNDKELRSEIRNIAIVARSKPETKMRIVEALQSNGEVVGVTGDGINDAPALTKADVGIAMGISGSEVSKSAADIILTDDNFTTIIDGIKWGRGVYENFQRFIQFQITVNIIAFLVAIISQILNFEMPFTTIQLLWINIIMDGPPALVLGLEPIRRNVFNRKPVNRNSSIITKGMITSIILNAIYVTSILLIQMKYNILGASTEKSGFASEMETVLFGLFAFSALFNAFNCREFGAESIFPNFFKNKIAIQVIFITGLAQIIFTQVFTTFFSSVALSVIMWSKVLGLAFMVIVVNEVIKFIIRMFRK